VSVFVTSWVWTHSTVKHRGDLLVLLALADHAHDDGTSAYPAVDTLARKARLTRRGAQLALRRLETTGAIRPSGRRGPHGQVEYQVLMADPGELASPVKSLRSEAGDTEGRSERAAGANSPSPEPSLTVQEPSKPLNPRKRGSKQSPLGSRGVRLDAVGDVFPTPPKRDGHMRPVGRKRDHEKYAIWCSTKARDLFREADARKAARAVDGALRAGALDDVAIRSYVERQWAGGLAGLRRAS
jgi:hypothetical protein